MTPKADGRSIDELLQWYRARREPDITGRLSVVFVLFRSRLDDHDPVIPQYLQARACSMHSRLTIHDSRIHYFIPGKECNVQRRTVRTLHDYHSRLQFGYGFGDEIRI